EGTRRCTIAAHHLSIQAHCDQILIRRISGWPDDRSASLCDSGEISRRDTAQRPPILMASLTLTPRGHLLFTVAEDALQPSAALTELEALAAAAPPMTGAEYITASVLETLWTQIAAAFRSELAESKMSVQEFLQRRSPAWHLVGRVHFNLAENRRDDEAPFAF